MRVKFFVLLTFISCLFLNEHCYAMEKGDIPEEDIRNGNVHPPKKQTPTTSATSSGWSATFGYYFNKIFGTPQQSAEETQRPSAHPQAPRSGSTTIHVNSTLDPDALARALGQRPAASQATTNRASYIQEQRRLQEEARESERKKKEEEEREREWKRLEDQRKELERKAQEVETERKAFENERKKREETERLAAQKLLEEKSQLLVQKEQEIESGRKALEDERKKREDEERERERERKKIEEDRQRNETEKKKLEDERQKLVSERALNEVVAGVSAAKGSSPLKVGSFMIPSGYQFEDKSDHRSMKISSVCTLRVYDDLSTATKATDIIALNSQPVMPDLAQLNKAMGWVRHYLKHWGTQYQQLEQALALHASLVEGMKSIKPEHVRTIVDQTKNKMSVLITIPGGQVILIKIPGE